MTIRHPRNRSNIAMPRQMPGTWLVSDARNDAVLETALRRLPRGSGFVFRHYHLSAAERRARFEQLCRIARKRGLLVALSASARQARQWGADAVYGPPRRVNGARGLSRLATVHSLRELARAQRAGADAVFLSPVFPTRSHAGAATLGAVRALLIAKRAQVPVIMLGGMNAARARQVRPHGWAAIDGLTPA